jgi:pyrroline-5-carboxylate reductase
MAITSRIGVIGGNGWLGGALIRTAVSTGIVDPAHLTISCRSNNRGLIADIAAYWTHDNSELVDRSDVIVLSVRPSQFRDLNLNIGDKLALSVMAGVSCETIAQTTGTTKVVRSMPNAAAVIGQSFTPWFATEDVSRDDKILVQTFLQASGDAVEVSEEGQIDYFTGMTGSGAAFPALLAEALIAHAVSHGIPREIAQRAAKKVVAGASQMFAGLDGDTGAIVKDMIDYRGVVAAALQTMLDRGFEDVVAAGLDAASAKAAIITST